MGDLNAQAVKSNMRQCRPVILSLLFCFLLLSLFFLSLLSLLSLSSASSWAAIPNAPSNHTATAAPSVRISLASADDCTAETGFVIERKVGATGLCSQIAAVGANVATYSTAGLAWRSHDE